MAKREFVDAIIQGNVNGLLDMFTNGSVDKTQLYVSLFFFISSMLAVSDKCLAFVHSSK